jgi:exodeoxyribonuclease VII small subunit
VAVVKFEQAIARLEAIVGELEKNDLPLDESLKIFEEGIRLSKSCLKILEEAEHKVEVLVQDKNGKKRIHAYSSDAADESSS